MKVQCFIIFLKIYHYHLVTPQGTEEKEEECNVMLEDDDEIGESQSIYEILKRIDDEIKYDYSPTVGEVWPIPMTELRQNKTFKLSPDLQVLMDDQDSKHKLLQNVVRRFSLQYGILKNYSKAAKKPDRNPDFSYHSMEITTIKLTITNCCEDLPHSNMAENYNLKIRSNILVEATNIWGAIRAFDTLIQLFYIEEDGTIGVQANTIYDAPEYSHRGLMIDTESHYLSINTILGILETMAMNKMNVLHWRIVGDFSFPYQSEVFPELSKKGAFYKNAIYSKEIIKNIIDFAAIHGIRVIPEFDIPAHLMSIRKSHPELMTMCFTEGAPYGPLNPTNETTLKIVEDLIKEVCTRFQDKYLHIGGEDIYKDCWASNPDVQNFIKNNVIYMDLHLYFVKHFIHDKLFEIDPRKELIVAIDILNNELADVTISKDTLTQAYKEDIFNKIKDTNFYTVILSWPWDLSNRTNMSLVHMYEKAEEIIDIHYCAGGEAFLYGDTVDDTNIFERIWPRACVVADVLWHGLKEDNDYQNATSMKHVRRRIEEHMCRMARYGAPVAPVGPGFCEVLEEVEEQPSGTLKQTEKKPDLLGDYYGKKSIFKKVN